MGEQGGKINPVIDDLNQRAGSSQWEPGTEPQLRTSGCHRKAPQHLSAHWGNQNYCCFFLPQLKQQWVPKGSHMFYAMKPFQLCSLTKKELNRKTQPQASRSQLSDNSISVTFLNISHSSTSPFYRTVKRWPSVLQIPKIKVHNHGFGALLLEKGPVGSEVGHSNRCSLPEVQFVWQREDSVGCSNCILCISSRNCFKGENSVTFLEWRERTQRNQ